MQPEEMVGFSSHKKSRTGKSRSFVFTAPRDEACRLEIKRTRASKKDSTRCRLAVNYPTAPEPQPLRLLFVFAVTISAVYHAIRAGADRGTCESCRRCG